MIPGFQPADYLLCGLTAVMAVTGLFRGFSGTLAFVLASAAAAGVGVFGWPQSAAFTDVTWMRGGGTLVAVLLAFGIVRAVVKKLVNGLLAQPTDAIFGFLVGCGFGVALLLAWAYSGLYSEFSYLVREASTYVR